MKTFVTGGTGFLGRAVVEALLSRGHHVRAMVRDPRAKLPQGAESIVVRFDDRPGLEKALEGTDADHFVTAVQWHPERSVESDQTSHNLFRALIDATR